jgi:hypothetical protein
MKQSQSTLSLYAGRVMYAALPLFLCVPLAAQTGETGGSGDLKIKAESRLVLVDAVVTARKDEPVANLTAKDFHVFEDGKEQPITAFQTHTGTPTGGIGRIQHFVLLFDGRSTDDPRWIEEAAAKFVADNAGPDRLIAVAYYDGGCMAMATQFTADVAQLQKALSDWPNTRRCPLAPDPLGEQRGLNYSQLARNLAQVPGHKVVALFFARTSRQASAADQGAGAPAGMGGPTGMAGTGGSGGLAGMGSGTGIGPGARQPSQDPGLAQTENAGASVLADPKGMQLEFRKADTSVYAVEGQSGARAPGWALTLAEKTGGRELSRGNDVVAAFALLAHEQDQAYTLGYVPADSPEGSCHALKITVDQPKVKVRGRDLYCNFPEVLLAAAKPAEVALESLATAPIAANTPASLALPYFYEGNAARIHLALEIPSPALEPTAMLGKLQASMDVVGLVYNADGSVAARFTDTAKFPFDNRQQFDDFVRQPLRYSHQLRVAPGNYKFKLVFRCAKDRIGVVEVPLVVDLFDPAQLAMSSIALSRDVQPISLAAAQAEFDAGKRPLIFHGKRFAVAGNAVFSKAGIGEAYFEVYEPPAKGTDPLKLTMRLRLFDAPTNQQNADSGDVDLTALFKPGDRAVPVGLKLPVAILAAGAYRAEITVKDSAGGEVSRSVQFRVE